MNKSEIFKAAHKLAKSFVGSYVARFALALKQLYSRIKKGEKMEVTNHTVGRIKKALKAKFDKSSDKRPFDLAKIELVESKMFADEKHPATTKQEFIVDGFNVIACLIPSLKKFDIKVTDGAECVAFYLHLKQEKQVKAVDTSKMTQKELEHYVWDLGNYEYAHLISGRA